MRTPILLIISLSVFLAFEGWFALEKKEVTEKTETCWASYLSGTEASIADAVCPSGNFFRDSGITLTKEKVCGSIAIQLSFRDVDTKALAYMKKLQDTRNPVVTSWTEDIRKTIRWYSENGTTATGLVDEYASACSTATFVKFCALTTDFFPETTCIDRAEMKARAWENMGYILAGRWVAKSFQNGKDTYIDKTKTAYDTLLKKWNSYIRMFGNAVSKFTAYIKNAVK